MKTRQQLLDLLGAHKAEMQERFAVSSIGLFGSQIREEARPDSDVDVLVEFTRPTFDRYMDLKFYLEDLFDLSVDLVLADSLKRRLKPIIEREVVENKVAPLGASCRRILDALANPEGSERSPHERKTD